MTYPLDLQNPGNVNKNAILLKFVDINHTSQKPGHFLLCFLKCAMPCEFGFFGSKSPEG